VASILNAEARAESKAAQTLLTAVIVDDVEGVILLTIALAMISEMTLSIHEGVRIAALAAIFILASIYLGGRLFPLLISRFARALSDEVLFAIFLGVGLVFAFAATLVGLAAITGAFIVGAVVPYSKVGEKMVHHSFFMKEIFAAVFFASIGLAINPLDIIANLPVALIVCSGGIAARLVGGLVGGKIGGLSGKQLTASTVGLAIRAEMSLIIAREGTATGMIGASFLPVAGTAVILSMVLMTPIYSRLIRSI
jgi:CPA2 family monovalent cation:H+ antiporter-2